MRTPSHTHHPIDFRRLAVALVPPGLAGLAAGLGVWLTADPELVVAMGGVHSLFVDCIKFCYVCLAAVEFARGLAQVTDSDDLLGDEEWFPRLDPAVFWGQFPNGFDLAAMAAAVAFLLMRVVG